MSDLIGPKIDQPALSPHYLKRSRLLDTLAVMQSSPLTVVCGPAGYGKTTLLSAWLATVQWPVTWVSLDQSDNELRLFVQYVVAAIHKCFPNKLKNTAALLQTVVQPEDQVVTRTLINDLNHIDQPFVLALDNYHLIQLPAIHELWRQVLTHPPQAFHLALATRHDPPFGLSTLRAHGMVVEIRTEDLQFTDAEAELLLERLAGAGLSSSVSAPLIEQLNGWAAGIQVAGLALRLKPALLTLKSPAMTTSHTLMAYLLDEVLMRQRTEVQEFLIKTSILNELNQALCDAVCGQASARSDHKEEILLDHLVQQGLFISTVNEAEGVYRYHALFQQLLEGQLQARCSAEEIEELYRRASDWHAGNGNLEEAMQYALKMRNRGHAGAILSRYRNTLMNENQWQRLEYWLAMLPREVINDSPVLLLAEAFIAHVRFRRSESQSLLSRIDDLVAKMPDSDQRDMLRGEVACLLAQHLYDNNDLTQAWESAQLAIQHVASENWYGHSVARLVGCGTKLALGDRAAAFELIHQAFTEGVIERGQVDGYRMNLLIVLGFLHAYTGDLSGLQQVSNEVLKYEASIRAAPSFHKWSSNLNWARYHLGMAHYHRNELDQAEAVLSVVTAQRFESHLNCAIQSMFVLALTYQAQARPDAAVGTVDLAVQHALEMRSLAVIPVIEVFRAQLALLQGRITDAIEHVADQALPGLSGPQWKFFFPHLTFARVHRAIGTPEALQQADALLAQLQAQAQQHHNPYLLVSVLAERAMLADVQGNPRSSLMHLELALAKAQTAGYLRIFADLGPRMADLLSRSHSRRVSSSFTRQVKNAFASAQARENLHAQSELIEQLTARELEVLELMNKRFRNKEIAESLYISTGTVKHHVHSIYQKLAVSSRREAVIKAMEMNLLKVE